MNTVPLTPLCPKCGERPRVVIVEKQRVRFALHEDGSMKILSTSLEVSPPVGYECGGGHTWEPA